VAVYTDGMERTNIYLDDETKAAAQHLKDVHGITTVSEAIRYAVREMARRQGWRSQAELKNQTPRGRRQQKGDTA
jgi:Arc/MetJ family transcription regulator